METYTLNQLRYYKIIWDAWFDGNPQIPNYAYSGLYDRCTFDAAVCEDDERIITGYLDIWLRRSLLKKGIKGF